MGAGLEFMDVGGGLGVDYDGSQTNFESSMNYTLQEYANDVVYHIQNICDEADVPHPTIISESGRAISAYHSVLVFNVLGVSGFRDGAVPTTANPEWEQPLADLLENGRRHLDDLGLAAADVLYVGDTAHDAEAARAMGLLTRSADDAAAGGRGGQGLAVGERLNAGQQGGERVIQRCQGRFLGIRHGRECRPSRLPHPRA